MSNDTKTKILIVDDNKANLFSLKSLLEQPDLEIFEALSGNEALSLMVDYDFAVVFLDVQMPGMSGFEVADLMRNMNKTRLVPIIFITARYSEEEAVFKGYESGAIDYLIKPVNPAILKSKVQIFSALYRQKKELEKAIETKEFLMREMNHRVKNNLSLINSFIALKLDSITSNAEKELMEELQNRISVIQLIHEKLYKSADLTAISSRDYLTEITEKLIYGLRSDMRINLLLDLEDMQISMDTAIPLGLIISELATNAIKYAYAGISNREFSLQLHSDFESGKARLSVKDNGIGLPPGFDPKTVKSLGLKLVPLLAEQLGGELRIEVNKGTTFEIMFPVSG